MYLADFRGHRPIQREIIQDPSIVVIEVIFRPTLSGLVGLGLCSSSNPTGESSERNTLFVFCNIVQEGECLGEFETSDGGGCLPAGWKNQNDDQARRSMNELMLEICGVLRC
jgi:hypothetical protein